jgi:hypothetical protein
MSASHGLLFLLSGGQDEAGVAHPVQKAFHYQQKSAAVKMAQEIRKSFIKVESA